jgi:hypothetical protein
MMGMVDLMRVGKVQKGALVTRLCGQTEVESECRRKSRGDGATSRLNDRCSGMVRAARTPKGACRSVIQTQIDETGVTMRI